MPQVIRNATEGIDTALEVLGGTRRIIELNVEQIEKGENDIATEPFTSAVEEIKVAGDALSRAREQLERTRPRAVTAPPIR